MRDKLRTSSQRSRALHGKFCREEFAERASFAA
jgi:hypothetical protein